MTPTQVKKRNNMIEPFNLKKIQNAIFKGMQASEHGTLADAQAVATLVNGRLDQKINENPSFIWDVEEIQDVVEEQLMESQFHDVAKQYIIYRASRQQERKRNIFKKRLHMKPYEYPELLQYVDAVRHSYWIHTEFNFTSDIQNFNVDINEVEKNAIKNTMLAIAQIEVSVKTFR